MPPAMPPIPAPMMRPVPPPISPPSRHTPRLSVCTIANTTFARNPIARSVAYSLSRSRKFMLIVFIAFVAMFDALLGLVMKDLSLQKVFGWIFSPAAFLMGVESADIEKVGTLLGAKLAINEHYAYLVMKGWKATPDFMTARSYQLTAFALTGFANFASVGIQHGGIGAMAPDRRHDLARLGLKALFVGFTATLLNAAIAGVFLN